MDHVKEAQKQHWADRIADVLQSEDNEDIPRDELAGRIIENNLVMHNGIRIDPLSYYNYPMLKMLMENKGVHEPQEEKIFQEVLKKLPAKNKLTMLELGAYWSFYSLWLSKEYPNANCYMVEPDRKNLFYGKRNFEINNNKGTFIHAGIGKQKNASKNITTVDHICKTHQINFIDILHADIQGFELEMLQGCEAMLSRQKIGYVFISTHSNELHYDCLKLLQEKYGFTLVASADLNETYSWDGIVVMKSQSYPGLEKINISKKSSKNEC